MRTFELQGATRTIAERSSEQSRALKALRKNNGVPCVLYGGKENINFCVKSDDLRKLIYTPHIYVVNLTIDGVAHTAIMLMLNLSSTMQTQIGMLAKGDRSNFTKYLQVPHVELNGKTIGVIGCGNIGRQVIKVAQAMEMKVLCYTRTPGADEENLHFVPLEELLKESDYVSLHCPLSDATRHLINEETIALMKPTAFLINTSRGALIDEPALIRALKAGKIAGAGLDVQETEPPAEDNPLYTMSNVIMTPHMGWKGLETRQRLVGVVENDIKSFFKGSPINVVS